MGGVRTLVQRGQTGLSLSAGSRPYAPSLSGGATVALRIGLAAVDWSLNGKDGLRSAQGRNAYREHA